uniref:Uncharacterized protein n=1 Tax=Cucumis melo TaxID=3656 RepID=A0A9I9DWT7_CUCME
MENQTPNKSVVESKNSNSKPSKKSMVMNPINPIFYSNNYIEISYGNNYKIHNFSLTKHWLKCLQEREASGQLGLGDSSVHAAEEGRRLARTNRDLGSGLVHGLKKRGDRRRENEYGRRLGSWKYEGRTTTKNPPE